MFVFVYIVGMGLVFIGLLYLGRVVFMGLLYSMDLQVYGITTLVPSTCNVLDTDVCRRDV